MECEKVLVSNGIENGPGRRGAFIGALILLALLLASATSATSAQTLAPMVGFGQVSLGDMHSCGLTADGEVRCWGDNNFGQLGDGTTTTRLTPVAVIGLSGIAAISSGAAHTCALSTNGSVHCWGANPEGRLGDGSTIQRWSPERVTGLERAVAISAGGYHTCALMQGGDVRCWGANHSGQLGDGTTTSRSSPVTVGGLATVVAISTGSSHSCALVVNGEVRCWGANLSGQLGNGTIREQLLPSPVGGLSGVVAISAGAWHTCALTAIREMRCWGSNTLGELGDGTTMSRSTPVAVGGLSGVAAISATIQYSCALTTGGDVYCWGRNDRGQLGVASSGHHPTPVRLSGLSGATAIDLGGGQGCALIQGGSVHCWGRNDRGQLGDGAMAGSRLSPVAVSGLTDVRAIDAGALHSCALLGGGEVRCWGENMYGQLGDGTRNRRTTPVTVAGLDNVAAVTAGDSHTCARTAEGFVHCWGYNSDGQLGDGTTTARQVPTAVGGLASVTAIAAGSRHTCAVTAPGDVFCWGGNLGGRLGDGTTTNRATPVRVAGITRAIAVSAGELHSCALLASGEVRCWGSNFSGQLGDGTTRASLSPMAVSGLSTVTHLASGRFHNCVVLADGALRCWGDNLFGRLGDGTETSRYRPVAVSGLVSGSLIDAGEEHTCALAQGDQGYCWGSNSNGQLGDGSVLRRSTPLPLADVPSLRAIAAGSRHTCALTSRADVLCWGQGEGGQLGDGTGGGSRPNVASVLTPVPEVRPDRVVIRENAAAVEIDVVANDRVTPHLLSGGGLSIASTPRLGAVSVLSRGVNGLADDVMVYKPNADVSGTEVLRYRLCFSSLSTCFESVATIEVRPVGRTAIDLRTPRDSGFHDEPMSALRSMSSARFQAHGLVKPSVLQVMVSEPTDHGTPWGAGRSATVLRTLEGGDQGRDWRVMLDAAPLNAADIDIHLGIDTNGNGSADPSELVCSSAMSSTAERCDLALSAPAQGSTRYWILLHAIARAASARLDVFETPLDMPVSERRLAATGPGTLTADADFPMRLVWNDPTLVPGQVRGGWLEVKSDDNTSLGWVPVRIERMAGVAVPFALRSGVDHPIALAASSAHEGLFIDVPPGTTRLDVTTSSAANADLYLARIDAPVVSGVTPTVRVAPARALAAASAVTPSGNETLTVNNPAPGRWYVTPVNAGAFDAEVVVTATLTGSGPQLRPGGYFNPGRSGTGLFLYPAGTEWAGLWYTYLQDGTTTWYYLQGAAPGATGIWRGTVFRSAWNGRSNHLTPVGEATVTPRSTSAFTFSYTLDGETGSEAYESFGGGCPTLDGAPLNVSGHWFDPTKAGTGYSVQLFPNYEFYAVFGYDAQGVPRYLVAERSGFGGASASMSLDQNTGACPLCDRTGNPVRTTVGTLSRTIGNATLQRIQLSGAYTAGVPGTWAANDAVIPLGGLQGCAVN